MEIKDLMQITKQQEAQFFKEQAQQDLLSFCIFTDKNFQVLPHHEVIADHLIKLMNWEIQNLIISMPPRAWKSRLMEEFIAYLIWHYSSTDVLYTWHTISILEDFSRHIRSRLNSNEYKAIFKSRITSDNAAVKSWKVEKGWVFSIFWVGWWITWKGWDLLVVDDPYKSRQDAESETVRRTVSDWYRSTLLSRKQTDKAKQVIIMQRWREDDLAWEILEKEWDKWVELKIPALNEKDESFWEERFSSDYFKALRAKSPIFFSSQYQQDPVNEWGWTFIKEYFEYYNSSEQVWAMKRLNIISFLDPAISKKQEADFTWLVTIWIDPNSNLIYVLEVKQLKEEPDAIIDEVFATTDKYKHAWASYRFWIEVVAYQKMLALEIKKQMRLRDKFFVMEEVNPQWEKEARIKSILQPRYSNRSILHSKSTENIWALETELLKFPNWKNDDILDSLAGCVRLTEVNNLWDDDEYYFDDNSQVADLDWIL